MYAAERRRQILEMIRNQASVTVVELAHMFHVSPSTIRRDLNELHEAELVERTYGGALTVPLNEIEAPFAERGVLHSAEKHRIGEAATRLVKTGETIIVDGGTTTECMATLLRDMSGITVATFGANLISRLAGLEQVTVIGIGGVLQHRTMTFGGVLALDALEVYNMRFDKAFLACTGVSAGDGVTNFGFDEIPLKRKAMQYAREVILLADSSKVGARAAGFVAPAARIHRLITDTGAAAGEVDALRQLGVLVDLV